MEELRTSGGVADKRRSCGQAEELRIGEGVADRWRSCGQAEELRTSGGVADRRRSCGQAEAVFDVNQCSVSVWYLSTVLSVVQVFSHHSSLIIDILMFGQ